MANFEVHFPQEDQPSRIKKWKVSKGALVTAGRVLLIYQDVATGKVEKKIKATQFGRVVELVAKENDVVHPGQVMLIMEGCKHPTVMKDLCAECGADLREELASNPDKTAITQAVVPMVHSIPELKVTAELAEKIGREDKERLLKHKQLVLLVDLDQTVVHTTNDNIPADLEDVYHFQLYGPTSPWYHTRLRPHTRNFLSEISKLYELHICTFGARQYAHKVASLLDNDGKLFSHRILSRDECFDPQSKTANLKALFPCGVDMVCIIDDRDDVWQGCANLVQVKPYHYFQHTGDINVPPGLGKHDDPTPAKSPTDEILRDVEKSLNVNAENGENKDEGKDEEEVIDNENNPKNFEKPKCVQEGVYRQLPESEEKEKTTEKDQPEEKEKIEIPSDKEKTNEEKCEKVNKDDPEKPESQESSDKKESKSRSGRRKHRKDKKEKFREEEVDLPPVEGQEWEDTDDYLLYLEDILKRIHAEFYSETETEYRTKSLREIIPKVRARVLDGLWFTFSGLVPNNQRLHQSRAYKVARAFGAQVTQDLTEQTTHLIAIQPGTVKVRAAKRGAKVKIVNPDWLWTCAERWERVDERLYPLKEVSVHKAREFRKPPAHCSTPDLEDLAPKNEDSFANTINPLMVFSQEEIANMDKEVEEDMSDFDSLDEDEENQHKRAHESDSNDVYGYDEEYSRGCDSKKKKTSDSDSESERGEDDDDDDDDPVTRFRRGEDLPDDIDLGDNSQDSVCDLEAEDMEDEREWNAMGAALEREFLSD